jgi:cytochrome c oxidase subunit II
VRRHIVIVGLLWLVLTAIGLVLANVPFQPVVATDKGEMIDETFKILLIMSVPVFTFVIAGLGYSAIVFRHRGQPDEDGAPITGRGPIPLAWFIVTSLMAVGVMVYPGLTELPKVVALADQPDVVVQVTGFRWGWTLNYPTLSAKSSTELVLPVGKTVGFEITSQDVVHSMWVPAFRMRWDAVPGLRTYMSMTPTEEGNYEGDANFRLQCSQLCGGEHARMMVPVRVVSDAEFTAWVAANATGGGGGGPVEGAQLLAIQANNPAGTVEFHFDPDALSATAGTPISVTFSNNDQGVIHNFAVLGADGKPLGATEFKPGKVEQVLNLDPLAAGTYNFLCQAHPTTMTGTLEVK